MPHHPQVKLSGSVTHIFVHRFVVETKDGAVLVDLTPHGRERIALKIGDDVMIEGERKPSEVKVHRITRDGVATTIDHPDTHGPHDHEPADPEVALKAVRKAGFKPVAEPRRKPKHFEVLGESDGRLSEFHVELDGHIRKQKPASRDDPKWVA